MTNNNNRPDLSKMTPLERRQFFSAAKAEIVWPDRPARRLPPKSRRNSVPRRSIR